MQNFDNTGLGQIATALDEAGAQIETLSPYRGDLLPETVSRYDAMVVLGGGQSAIDDEDHPYLPHLAALMCGAADSGRAVLGVCLGSQILARGCGAENLLGGAREFSWREVALTGEGIADPVLGVLPKRFPIFQWHDDTFSLPKGAARLAENDATPNQAFRVGRAGYGIQFHFEADRKLVSEWSSAFADHLALKQPDWRERHPREAELHGPAADAAGLALARAWVRMI